MNNNPNAKARVAFKDVSNRGVSNSKSLKSKVTKPSHKRNVATIYKSTEESSSLVVHKKTVVTKSTKQQQPVEYIDIPVLKHGLDTKRSTSNKSFQSKLRQPTKLSSSAKPASLSKPKPSYQDGRADDIDANGSNDPLLVTEYISEMYTYHRSEEHRAIVGPYLDSQPEINQRMRSILIDWLVDVHYKMKFFPETLYITVNIVDRFLAKKEVPRRKLQLVGVTSFLIASKYEEIYPPSLYDLVYVCDNAYSKQEILDMEENILKTLNYQLSIPNPYKFLVRYLNAAHADKKIVLLSSFVLEESLLLYELITSYKPSELASSAVLIARKVSGRNPWSPTLVKYTGYREENIKPLASQFLAERGRIKEMKLMASKKKYSRSNMSKVASIDLPTEL